MTYDPADHFRDLAEQRYPGSRQVRKSVTRQRERPVEPGWDASPKVYKVNGVPTEFFDIGALAKALNRRPPTIRQWEAEGVIPKAVYSKGAGNGRRRLYTRAMVEGMRAIAEEEGLLRNEYQPIKTTRFTQRVYNLFVDLLKQEQQRDSRE